jgi:hypothetical protein
MPVELVKVKTGQVHVSWARRHVQSAEDHSKPVSVLRLNPRLVPGGEEPLDSFVPESLDRHI